MLCSLLTSPAALRAQESLELSGPAQVPPVPLADDPVDAPDMPEGAEVMVTGPLHEAFAEQFSDEAEPGIVISKRPPELINEIPPEYRPEGADIVWIPGYWGWDPDREDFLWITGIWRQAPPDRNWVPGYWAEVAEGYQWIAGFWSLRVNSEIRYLPTPPEALAADPSTPAPSEEHFWIPGQWSYVNDNYQWRAGYWTMGYPDWVWVPDRYVWTPSGCIYRAGYWDFLVQERGTVFCPVYWAQQPVVNYSFRPTYVVSTGPNLLANLFVYPRYHHYFFGNYYSSRNLGQTIYPWVTYGQQSRRYDSMYGYYHSHRRDNDYLNRITRLHTYYAANTQYQPPRTLTAQRQHHHDMHDRQDLNFHAMQLNKMFNTPNNINHHMQLVKLADNERQQIVRGLDPAKDLWKQRAQFEGKPRPGTPGNDRGGNDLGGRDNDNRGADNRSPDNRLDGKDRRWNLPQGQDGVRLGSISIGNPDKRDGTPDRTGDRDGRGRDGSVRNDRTPNGNDGRSNSRDDFKPGDNNRDGIVNDLDSRNRDMGDRNSRDGQNRDPLNRDPLNRDPLVRDGQNRDGQNRGPLNRDGLARDGQDRNPGNRDAGKDGPPKVGPSTGRTIDPKTLPAGTPGTTPILPGRTGETNKGQPDTRNPLPGKGNEPRDRDNRDRDNNARTPGRNPALPNNLPGSSPGLPGNTPRVPNNLPGTSPGIKPGNDKPRNDKPGNAPKLPGLNPSVPSTGSSGPSSNQRDRTPKGNPPSITQPKTVPPKIAPPQIAPPKIERPKIEPPKNAPIKIAPPKTEPNAGAPRRGNPPSASNAPRRAPQQPAGGKPEKQEKPKDKK